MYPRWSCYVYIAADNDLRNTAEIDLKEISRGDATKVNVVVQVDRTDEPTQRHILELGGLIALGPTRSLFGNNDSGEGSTLTDFIKASKHLKRGDSTALILNGHGTGLTELKLPRLGTPSSNGHGTPRNAVSRMFASAVAFLTDSTSRSFLDNQELRTALRKALGKEEKYEIIGFDACLMGMVEIAYQVRDLGTFLVASQDNESTAGWPYQHVLNSFTNTRSAGAAAFAVVENYSKATVDDPDATLSAVSLGLMDNIADTLDQLGGALLPLVKQQILPLARARQAARTFANFDSIDLYGFVDAIRTELEKSLPDATAKEEVMEAAASVLAAIKQSVIHTSKNPEYSRAHGLSVYVPNAPVFDAYHALPFCKKAPRWHDFVVAYAGNRSVA